MLYIYKYPSYVRTYIQNLQRKKTESNADHVLHTSYVFFIRNFKQFQGLNIYLKENNILNKTFILQQHSCWFYKENSFVSLWTRVIVLAVYDILILFTS